jgi:toxin FitB
MKVFLLDTNVISEVRRLRPHGAVVAWLRTLAPEQIRISAVSIGEIQAGIEITRDQDIPKAQDIERWLEQVVATYAIVPVDAAVMRAWAKLMHSRPDDLYEDAMIAATALVHGFTLATRNTTDFAGFGLALFDPFKTK